MSVPPAGVAPVQTGAPVPGTAPAGVQTSGPAREYNNHIVGKINYTAKQLFEVTGFVDLSKKFPEASAFVTVIPGIPDNTKATGITYNQAAKETMKISVRDLFAMGEAILMAVKGEGGDADFVVYTDSSKASANGQGVTKQCSIGAGEFRGKKRIYINYKGNSQIQLSLDKWHAVGVAKQIEALANETVNQKLLKEREAAAAFSRT